MVNSKGQGKMEKKAGCGENLMHPAPPIQPQRGGTAKARENLEFALLLIPSLAVLIDARYPHNKYATVETVAFLLFVVPVLVCLLIITMRHRRHNVGTVLLRYAFVGFILPPLMFFCYVTGLFFHWIHDSGAFGWLLMMVPLAAIAFSLITTAVGMLMFLVAKTVQWGSHIVRPS